MMDYALKAMEADSGTLYLVDGGDLSFEVSKGPGAKKFKGLRLRAGSGIAGLVAGTGKPYVSAELNKDRVWAGIRASKAHNMLAVPLRMKKKVAGVIEVINKADGAPFTKADLNSLTSLANHFSIIIERLDMVAELEARVEQFSTLNEVSGLLNSTLDQRTVRRRAMEAITGLMRAEAGSLLLVDEKTGQLYFEVALGKKGAQVKQIRLDIGEGIAGWVAKHGRPLVIPDVARDGRFSARADRKSRFKTRDMVCVPVKIKGKVAGVLQAINRRGGSFGGEDVNLFELFSNQVAVALDNARLYEEILDTFYATSGALAEAIEKRDPYTGGHTRRVLDYSLAIAVNLGLSGDELELVKLSALLHDIGKIGVEDCILRKEAPLTSGEAAMMKMHPQMGAEILRHVPRLKDIIPGMLCHHERMDGTGYPEGLKNGAIPIIARIISVADTYDAMTTARPSRAGLSH
ncbi:MAG: GAF domain-containing protein, partial [Deltaproteobacteria bacterium]